MARLFRQLEILMKNEYLKKFEQFPRGQNKGFPIFALAQSFFLNFQNHYLKVSTNVKIIRASPASNLNLLLDAVKMRSDLHNSYFYLNFDPFS